MVLVGGARGHAAVEGGDADAERLAICGMVWSWSRIVQAAASFSAVSERGRPPRRLRARGGDAGPGAVADDLAFELGAPKMWKVKRPPALVVSIFLGQRPERDSALLGRVAGREELQARIELWAVLERSGADILKDASGARLLERVQL